MDLNDDFDDNDGETKDRKDIYARIRDNQLRKKKRKTVRSIDTPLTLPGYGMIGNMAEIRKIPQFRNAYLREAFFKCHFDGLIKPKSSREPIETLRIFAKLFFYHQELRIETRKIFDRYNGDNLKENEFLSLKVYLGTLVADGCKAISTMPKPVYDIKDIPTRDNFEDEEKFRLAIDDYLRGSDIVDITFNHKKRDFPRSDELFRELTRKDVSSIIMKDDRRFIRLLKQNHSLKNYITISGKLWIQAVSLLVLDAIKELEEEIHSTGFLYAHIPQYSIQAAIDHFNQTYPRANEMDKNEKAYSISLRYKDKIKDMPFQRESILRALSRNEKSV